MPFEMYRLFELGIFRTDEPYELVYTDELNEAVNTTLVNFEIFGYPGSPYRHIRKCVHHHLYHQVDGTDENGLIDKIASILHALGKAGLLENVRKKVTEEDIKRIKERVDQERENIYGKEEKCPHCSGTGEVEKSQNDMPAGSGYQANPADDDSTATYPDVQNHD